MTQASHLVRGVFQLCPNPQVEIAVQQTSPHELHLIHQPAFPGRRPLAHSNFRQFYLV